MSHLACRTGSIGSYRQLKRVAALDAANSYLYRKTTGAGITGDRMPQTLPPLSDAQIKLLRDWIRRGAPND